MHTTNTSRQLLTTEQAAEVLGVTPGTLVTWRCIGRHRDLPYIKVGRSVKYRRTDLEAWLESHTVGQAPEPVAA